MPNLRGEIYLYKWFDPVTRRWIFKFYREEQPDFVKPGEFELVYKWFDCNKLAALEWVRHKYGAKECIAPNQGAYRLSYGIEGGDVEYLTSLRKLPPGTTSKLSWWEE
jgi:hypothetical protein